MFTGEALAVAFSAALTVTALAAGVKITLFFCLRVSNITSSAGKVGAVVWAFF